jgi:hypothetical protein
MKQAHEVTIGPAPPDGGEPDGLIIERSDGQVPDEPGPYPVARRTRQQRSQ